VSYCRVAAKTAGREASLRAATFVLCGLDTVLWLAVVGAALMSQPEPATAALDNAVTITASLLYAGTTLPALGLALAGRARRGALALAAAFPAVFGALFVAAVVVFA
jgi:hypothetical protein